MVLIIIAPQFFFIEIVLSWCTLSGYGELVVGSKVRILGTMYVRTTTWIGFLYWVGKVRLNWWWWWCRFWYLAITAYKTDVAELWTVGLWKKEEPEEGKEKRELDLSWLTRYVSWSKRPVLCILNIYEWSDCPFSNKTFCIFLQQKVFPFVISSTEKRNTHIAQ